jgi:hypothetical protein
VPNPNLSVPPERVLPRSAYGQARLDHDIELVPDLERARQRAIGA